MSSAQVTPRLTPQAANGLAIKAILGNSIKKRIQLPSQTVVPASINNTLNVPLRNVGILRGCLVKVTATVSNTDGAVDATVAPFGPAAMFSQVVYNDFSNITRIQTTGAHVFMLDSLRRQGIMGASFTNDNPGTFGAVWTPIKAATVAHGATGTVISYHWIPATYSDDDFRGAVFSNITNANQSLTLTFNPNVCIPTGTDPVFPNTGMFAGPATANVSITSAIVQVYQDVWDQLPSVALAQSAYGISPADWTAATGDATGLMLPNLSMRWMYELKNVPFTGFGAGVDNAMPYTNQRQFLSTIAQYQNPARALGTDINYFQLIAANSYEFWKQDPLTIAFESRRLLGDDFPTGFYTFDTRNRVINTTVSGNINLVLNPITAAAGNQCNLYYEDFALTASITGATALAGV